MDKSPIPAMPLRIAVLSGGKEAAEQFGCGFPLLTKIEKVLVVDDFESALQNAIELVNQGCLVQLSTESRLGAIRPVLWLLAGLTAAQNKIHPHAYLSGFIQQNEPVVSECIEKALKQARRLEADLSNQQTFHALTATQKLFALHKMVNAIASRSQEFSDGKANQYWFTDPNKARVTSIAFESTQSTSCLVLTQATGLGTARSILSDTRLFFVISGKSESELQNGLNQLRQTMKAQSSQPEMLIELMADNLRQFESDKASSSILLAIVLQGASIEAVLQEITAIEKALPNVMDSKGHYKTPAGSSFSAAPQGLGGLSFVYPGVGTVYPGMLAEFHQYFPKLYARLEREGNLKDSLQTDKIYSETPIEMSLSELAIAGVGTSYLLTQLLCDEFNIKPDFALGYSKGEASMWASLNVWKDPHALIEMTKTSPIFTSAISGELTAVRQAWNLSDDEEIIWNSFVVRSDAAAIEVLLPDFPRAYLAIIQGDTCVIAGCEDECRRLLKKLGKRGIAANRVTAMHTPPALSQHQQVVAFYQQPICDVLPEHIRFISASGLLPNNADKPVSIESQSIAHSIADTYCTMLDFTALIRSARQHGAGLFVEVGADRQTCTLIDKINRADNVTNENATIAVNAKGGEDILTLLKCIGQLISHQTPLSLEPLISGLEQYQIISEVSLEGELA